MKNVLLEKLQDKRVVHRIKKEHKKAKHVLNKALSRNIEYTIDIRPYCNELCHALYDFDNQQIKAQIKRYGNNTYKPIKLILYPNFINELNSTTNAFQRTYVVLIHTVRVIASFMDRYELGTGDWTKKAEKNVRHFLAFQPTYNTNISLDSYITQPQYTYTVMQAGHDVRQMFPHKSV